MTISKIYSKLRKGGKGQYLLLSFCTFLSVLLITAFALMYFGPTVQTFLPEGGDTRKMANLLIGATAIGCFIFTVYASGLFFRYKSREYGILMALGMPKKNLRILLFKELSLITAISSILGLLGSIPVSYLIWKLFEFFIISNAQMTHKFGAAGFLPGIYLVMLNIVAQNRLVKNKKKYYKNLVSVSLMRFTAKQTTRSMCVIVLLLFVCFFSSFYGMRYFLTPGSLEEDGRAFSLHYPAAENQIGRAEIEETAEKYNLSVENYSTNEAANLVISYRHKDFAEDDSQYVELYEEKGRRSRRKLQLRL